MSYDDDIKSVNWIELNRTNDGNPSVSAYAGGEAKFTRMYDGNKAKLIEFLNAFQNVSSVLVAETDKKIIPNRPDIGRSAKKVLIDPGHSELHPGARGINPSVQEEDLNRIQAQCLKTELQALGIYADIIDPLNDDLYAIGCAAQGYDAFISLHLNAYDKKEHYTCTMCHSSKQRPDSKSATVASRWAKAIASANNNKLFSGSQGWPEGVMAVGLSVLSGACTTNCPIKFLSEAEFVDDETDTVAITERIKKAMNAGAAVLAECI